jgi:predicted site-specific integrase-resolvase
MASELTPAQAAERLGIGKSTIQLWCKRGDVFPNARLEKTPRGDVYQIPENDLMHFTPPKMGRPRKPRKEAA